jgi:hypothetical protein
LDPEAPQANGKSPITDPKGSTPEDAVVVTLLHICIYRMFLSQIRRLTDSGEGGNEPNSSAEPRTPLDGGVLRSSGVDLPPSASSFLSWNYETV